jgi:parallel beta-helix repeat protein
MIAGGLALGSATVPGTAAAATTTVSSGESIQAAIDSATSGDTIEVEPGTYDGNLILYKNDITLRSTDGPKVTTIDAGGIDRSAILEAASDPNDAKNDTYEWALANDPGLLKNGVMVFADDVTVEGFTVINASFPSDYNRGIGILLGMINSTYAGFHPDNRDQWGGIVPNPTLVAPSGCMVANNVVTGASDGIYAWSGVENHITGNQLRDSGGLGGSGLQMYGGGTDTVVEYNTFESNEVWGAAIGNGDFDGTTVRLNNFLDNGVGGLVYYSASPTPLQATCNYWAHATGPGNEKDKGEMIYGGVKYTPWNVRMIGRGRHPENSCVGGKNADKGR